MQSSKNECDRLQAHAIVHSIEEGIKEVKIMMEELLVGLVGMKLKFEFSEENLFHARTKKFRRASFKLLFEIFQDLRIQIWPNENQRVQNHSMLTQAAYISALTQWIRFVLGSRR